MNGKLDTMPLEMIDFGRILAMSLCGATSSAGTITACLVGNWMTKHVTPFQSITLALRMILKRPLIALLIGITKDAEN